MTDLESSEVDDLLHILPNLGNLPEAFVRDSYYRMHGGGDFLKLESRASIEFFFSEGPELFLGLVNVEDLRSVVFEELDLRYFGGQLGVDLDKAALVQHNDGCRLLDFFLA